MAEAAYRPSRLDHFPKQEAGKGTTRTKNPDGGAQGKNLVTWLEERNLPVTTKKGEEYKNLDTMLRATGA